VEALRASGRMQLHNEPTGIPQKKVYFYLKKKYTVLLSKKEEINIIHFLTPFQIYNNFSSTSRVRGQTRDKQI